MELIELCGVMAAPSADFLQDLPVLRRFLGAYTRLEVEEIRMRLYNEHGVLKPPPGVVNVLIIILLSAAANLGCEYPISCDLEGSPDPVIIFEISTVQQFRMMACVALLSYASMHGFTNAMPYEMLLSGVIFQLQSSLSALDVLTSVEGKSLLFSCEFRCLFRAISLCREAVQFADANLRLCAKISRLALSILERAATRFDGAECYVGWCRQLTSEMTELEGGTSTGGLLARGADGDEYKATDSWIPQPAPIANETDNQLSRVL